MLIFCKRLDLHVCCSFSKIKVKPADWYSVHTIRWHLAGTAISFRLCRFIFPFQFISIGTPLLLLFPLGLVSFHFVLIILGQCTFVTHSEYAVFGFAP